VGTRVQRCGGQDIFPNEAAHSSQRSPALFDVALQALASNIEQKEPIKRPCLTLSATMKSGMIKLKPSKQPAWEGGLKGVPVTFAYPYFKSGSGTYVHRVRSATTHVDKKKGQNSHVSLHAWCGCIGFVHPIRKAKTANQFAEPPPDALFCATCEGRAIGAGCDANRQINGKNVMYSPRPK